MSSWADYLDEKQRIDAFADQGYAIIGIREHLDGMDVLWSSEQGTELLIVVSADARKYVSSLIIARLLD
ncbi:hypothetical protein RB620_07850 [Paenibacillus sp. LHD-117]|uniref:hypothetical protein n=1 Tax=Paenibacillus sp. LHD-117 TaxID=3071412 RepID=UPI0027E0A7DA|nr:hypothetical protein [Paenibacillus sp. LHD-117]MDQ6419342.1 hypothetical protein [Paenibacillus sp. LHD-117]